MDAGQVSEVYFKSYQLAYDHGETYRTLPFGSSSALEDPISSTSATGTAPRKGLLAGEKLYHDIKRMEMAYLDNYKREDEPRLMYSLALNDPVALLKLKQTGECMFEIPEELLTRDRPEFFMCRIRSLSVTIPCVSGPYTTISAKLTLLKNSCRVKPIPVEPYLRQTDDDDARFKDNLIPIQHICTSTGQNDFGLHEFRFEDARYNPFEFAGAISQWRLELMKDKDLRQFDYESISDVVLDIRVTARDGGPRLAEQAKKALREKWSGASDAAKPLIRLFSVKHEFPTEWHRFVNSTDLKPRLVIKLQPLHFPYPFRDSVINVQRCNVFAKSAGNGPLKLTLGQVERITAIPQTSAWSHPQPGSGSTCCI